jgi:hypothetical protein
MFFVLYLYNSAFKFFRMGYASALAWILFFLLLAMTLLVFRSSALGRSTNPTVMLKNLFVPSVPCNPIGMSTLLHEAMVLLFKNRPDLAPELLRRVFGIELPPFAEVRVASAELSEVVPREHRADLIVLLLDGKPVLAIVLEVQLSRDPDKHTSWHRDRARAGCGDAGAVGALGHRARKRRARLCHRPGCPRGRARARR